MPLEQTGLGPSRTRPRPRLRLNSPVRGKVAGLTHHGSLDSSTVIQPSDVGIAIDHQDRDGRCSLDILRSPPVGYGPIDGRVSVLRPRKCDLELTSSRGHELHRCYYWGVTT